MLNWLASLEILQAFSKPCLFSIYVAGAADGSKAVIQLLFVLCFLIPCTDGEGGGETRGLGP